MPVRPTGSAGIALPPGHRVGTPSVTQWHMTDSLTESVAPGTRFGRLAENTRSSSPSGDPPPHEGLCNTRRYTCEAVWAPLPEPLGGQPVHVHTTQRERAPTV